MVSPRAGATPPSSRLLGGGVPARGCYRKREWLCVRFPTLGERHMLSHPCSERWRATQFTSLYGISLRWPHIFPPWGLGWCRSTWLRLRGQTRGRDGGLRGKPGGVSWLQLCAMVACVGRLAASHGSSFAARLAGAMVAGVGTRLEGAMFRPTTVSFTVYCGPAKRTSVCFTVFQAPGIQNLS